MSKEKLSKVLFIVTKVIAGLIMVLSTVFIFITKENT